MKLGRIHTELLIYLVTYNRPIKYEKSLFLFGHWGLDFHKARLGPKVLVCRLLLLGLRHSRIVNLKTLQIKQEGEESQRWGCLCVTCIGVKATLLAVPDTAEPKMP